MLDKRRDTIEEAVRTLLPFIETTVAGAIETKIEPAPLELLRRFYLFKVSGLVTLQAEKDLPRFLEQRFLNLLSAAHRAGWTVLTAAIGSSSGVEIFFGFMTKDNASVSEPYVFERILTGLFPGLGVDFVETPTIETFLHDKSFGGLVAGVPTLKIDDERQRFSLPSTLRSLHGEDYALLMLSRPIEPEKVAEQLKSIWHIRDNCHRLARQTLATESGEAISEHEEHTEGMSETESRFKEALVGTAAGAAAGYAVGGAAAVAAAGALKILILEKALFGLVGAVTAPAIAAPTAIIGAGIGASILLGASGQKTKTTSRGHGQGRESHWSESLSQEEQNSLALELERLAQRHAERLLKAANVGEWETSITFATRTEAGRDILAGSLLGELAKPSTDVFPPKIHYSTLDADCPLLLPNRDQPSAVFPRSLASYLTSEELASIAAPPSEQLPGYEIRHIPALSLTDTSDGKSGKKNALGSVCDHGRALAGIEIEITSQDLAKHLFVCGLTGTGKTTTVKEVLTKAEVPFLVIESAKRDYRQLLGLDAFRDKLKVYTVGDASIAPIRMNPFYVMPGVPPLVHIDFLKALFNASFSLYGPMPYILEKCLHNVYLKRGWNLTAGHHPRLCTEDGTADKARYQDPEAEHWFPTLIDLREEVQEYVRTGLEYRGELADNIRTAIVVRLDSLSVGAKGVLFGTSKPLDIADLLKHPTVLELESLSDDDDNAFFVGLMLTFISEYRQSNNPALNPYASKVSGLQHLLVIEEAHRLLKNVVQERQTEQLGNPRGKAVEFFANVISEMRSLGQGVIVVEQIPTKILPDVIKNTNAKIAHRLVARDDQTLMAASLGLTEEESLYLTSLKTGHALYLKEGMQRPVELEIHASVSSTRISHEHVMKKAMDPSEVERASAVEVRQLLGAEGDVIVLRALCTLATCEPTCAESCVRNALAILKTKLMTHDHRANSGVIRRYLADRIVSCLALGVFNVDGEAIRGVSTVVSGVTTGKPDALSELRQRLSSGWGVRDSRIGVVKRIRELVLDRAIRAKAGRDSSAAIEQIASTYFLGNNPMVVKEIVDQVTARLGGEQWTQ